MPTHRFAKLFSIKFLATLSSAANLSIVLHELALQYLASIVAKAFTLKWCDEHEFESTG